MAATSAAPLCCVCATTASVARCSACTVRHYCSAGCQAIDWIHGDHWAQCGGAGAAVRDIGAFAIDDTASFYLRPGNTIVVGIQTEAVTVVGEKPMPNVKGIQRSIEWRPAECLPIIDETAYCWVSESFRAMHNGYVGKAGMPPTVPPTIPRRVQSQDPFESVGKVPPPARGAYRVYMVREVVMTYATHVPAKEVVRNGAKLIVADERYVPFDEQVPPNRRFRLWRNVKALESATVGRTYLAVASSAQDANRRGQSLRIVPPNAIASALLATFADMLRTGTPVCYAEPHFATATAAADD